MLPNGTIGPLLFEFGFCTSGLLTENEFISCINQKLDFSEFVDGNIAELPSIPYTFIQVIFNDT